MKTIVMAGGAVLGLVLPLLVFSGLKAEPTRAQYCLTEGWHFDNEPVRNLVIAQCMGKAFPVPGSARALRAQAST